MSARLWSTKLSIEGFYEGGLATLEMELHGESWYEFIEFCKKRPRLDSVRFEDDALVIRFNKPYTQTSEQTPSNETKETTK